MSEKPDGWLYYSGRKKVAEMVKDWYAAHLEYNETTQNTLDALNELGLLRHPDTVEQSSCRSL